MENMIRLGIVGDAVIDTYGLHVNSLGDVSTDNDVIDPCYIESITIIREEIVGSVVTMKEYTFVYKGM